MNSIIRKVFRLFIPPVFFKILPKSKQSGIFYSGNFNNWDEARSFSSGYDSTGILKKVKEATLMVKSGKAEYERDSVIFDHIEYSLPVISGLLLAASKNNGHLRVLDFGGSLGSTYFQNRKFLKELKSVKWGVIEQPHFVECGKKYFEDNQLLFFNTIEDCLQEFSPNVVIFGSVLQYIPNSTEILSQIEKINFSVLVIDRIPVSQYEKDQISIQYVPKEIYEANYPIWIFSKALLISIKCKHWKLLEEFKSIGFVNFDNNLKFNYQSFLFVNQND
jgi:putative methyltransferase (TIGR04325 family)